MTIKFVACNYIFDCFLKKYSIELADDLLEFLCDLE